MKYKCPCRGFYTFEERLCGNYDICKVYFGEDDPIQLDDENFENGANGASLLQARKNFLQFEAFEKDWNIIRWMGRRLGLPSCLSTCTRTAPTTVLA